MFNKYEKIADLSKLIGICCFTKELPKSNLWGNFPKGHNGIFIEYDKEIIEQHLIDIFGLGDCFKDVEYLTKPTLLNLIANMISYGNKMPMVNHIKH